MAFDPGYFDVAFDFSVVLEDYGHEICDLTILTGSSIQLVDVVTVKTGYS